MRKTDGNRPAMRLLIFGVGLLLFCHCATFPGADTLRPNLASLFLKSKEQVLEGLPKELRESASVGENQIVVAKSLTKKLYNMILTVRTDSAIFRFSDGKLYEIEIKVVSESGAMDADFEDLRRSYRDLEARYMNELGVPAKSLRETVPQGDGKESVQVVASSRLDWSSDPGRKLMPDIDVVLEYKERQVQGVFSIRIRELYTLVSGKP
jgi:hypothetical protein